MSFESKAGRKEPPASKELWVGSCRIGLGKWRALPELSDFIPITASHCYFFRCSRVHRHTLATGRVSTGTQAGGMDGMVLGSDPLSSGGNQR